VGAARAGFAAVPRRGGGVPWVGAKHPPGRPPPRRDGFVNALKAQGIPTAIHYPRPVHQQAPYRGLPVADGGLPVTERLSEEVVSLPMHAYLDEPTQDRIVETVRRALAA